MPAHPTMSVSVHTEPNPIPVTDLNATDLKTVQRRFRAINRDRLTRLADALPQRQQPFVQLLPLLLHANHPALPGFVTTDAPHGVCGYSPTQSALTALSKFARGFDYKKRAPLRFDIEAIFLIGSAGTIAYSEKSDFDVWLVHREDLPESGRAQLHAKATELERWAAALDLEVHFFVLTAADVRSGRQKELSRESSGSAQRHLLLDEFYRTALLVAGRDLLWWYVPPDADAQYDAVATTILGKKFLKPSDVVDFGGVPRIPASEYFGAALWQLFKAVGSPYKSLLKILLLETYADAYPHTELLSQRFKRAVYAGEVAQERLDPYVMMLQHVERYLQQIEDGERLELARRSFYLKTNQCLSRSRSPTSVDYRRTQLQALIERWGWTLQHLEFLDGRGNWKVERVRDEWRLLVRGLMRSYRFLSRFAREKADITSISQTDMTILGRRLFAAFEHRSGKLERIGGGVQQDLTEPHLVLESTHTDGHSGWQLLRGGVAGDDLGLTAHPLKRGRSLPELLAWAHFNGISGTGTHLSLPRTATAGTQREASEVLAALQRQYPTALRGDPDVEQLRQASHPVAATLFINLGVDPLAHYTRQGIHLTTERRDPLNYGSREENLLLCFDYLFATNWQEIFLFHYEGLEGLLACLCNYLEASVAGPITLVTHCFSPDRGTSIAQRIGELFNDVRKALAGEASSRATHYILKGGNEFFCLFLDGEIPRHQRLGPYPDLLEYLSQPGPAPRMVVFDPHALQGSPLPLVLSANVAGRVQVFFQLQDGHARVFVLDETGALFHDDVTLFDQRSLLNQYARFLDAVFYRENAADAPTGDEGRPPLPDFYRILRVPGAEYQLQKVEGVHAASRIAYVEIQAIGDPAGSGLTIYCDGEEFSTMQYGDLLYEAVARQVLSLRDGQGTYPIYITDIDLAGLIPRPGSSLSHPTVLYLQYKREVEHRLNDALRRLSAPSTR